MTIDHQRCSELLTPFIGGELDREQAEQVDAHLGSCAGCRLEEQGLRALLAPMDDAELQQLESARLHREVWAAVRPEVRVPARSWQARLAPYLGAAAATLLLAVGLIYGGVGSGGDDEMDSGGAGSADIAEDPGAGGSAPYSARDEDDASTEDAALEATAEEEVANDSSGAAAGGSDGSVAGPVFETGGNYTSKSLQRTGRSGYPFTAYAADYGPTQARRMQKGSLDRLAVQAGGAGSEIRACGRTVLDAGNSAGESPLPAWAALGDYGARSGMLIFGVAYSSDTTSLDRYSFWVFDRTDCSDPVEVIDGAIEN